MPKKTVKKIRCSACKEILNPKTDLFSTCRYCGKPQCAIPVEGNFDCASIACCDQSALSMVLAYAKMAGLSLKDVLIEGITLDDLMERAEEVKKK